MRFLAELGRQIRLVGTAGAGAGRVAALRHESGDHAMKHHAIVKAILGQFGDALDMLWRQIGAQLDDHGAIVKFEREGLVCHKRVLSRLLFRVAI